MFLRQISFLFTILAITACTESGTGDGSESPIVPSEIVEDVLDKAFETDPTASGQVKVGQCYEDQYAPVPETITRKLDIIIVPDTSGSITEERGDIATGFESFINGLPAEVDFRVGVILGHSPYSSRSGKLYKKGSEDLVLDSQVLDTATIISSLHTKLRYPATDWKSDGGEMGIISLTSAITDNLASIRGQGLFREDAALAIIFVADEQDICAEFPDGVVPVPDPQGKEDSSYATYCVDGDGKLLYHPEQLMDDLYAIQGDRPLVVGGIIYNNSETIPFNGENEIGYGYLETIKLAKGMSVDLASGDYSQGLTDLGKLAQVSIKPENDFKINTDKLDTSSIEVLVNNIPAEFTYDSILNLVSLTNERDPFDIVKLNYCEKAELPKEVTKIIAGGSHTCAILHDGNLKCWGQNSYGQLGYGHTNPLGDNEKPSSIPALNFGQKVIDATAGLYHTCVLLEDGSVKCFGGNSKGQLGQGNIENLGDNETIDVIPSVPLGRRATKIYAGTRYNCALLDNQYIKCWGENNYGQLGYGHTNNLGDDELISNYGNVSLGDKAVQMDISTISYHTCAVLKSSDALKCWGLNNVGQLGYGHTNNLGDDEIPSSFGNVSFGNKVLQIATGYSHTCALSGGQEVRCWGSNSVGQTGYGSKVTIGDNEAADSAAYLDLGSGGSLMVATGNAHTCTLGKDESIYCFGLGALGQIGHGNKLHIGDDEAVLANSKVAIDLALSQVVAGLNHTCTLTKDEGKIICFGHNSNGQLGYGHKSNIGDDEIPWEFLEVLTPEVIP